MTNPLKRGSAPDRARPDDVRPGSFKSGHEKRGGRERERGTPNLISVDYKKALFEAAYRVGYDGNGEDGVVGYLRWVAIGHAAIFPAVLSNIMPLQVAESNLPEKPRWTMEEINQRVRDYLSQQAKTGRRRKPFRLKSRSPWDWTGQPFPVGALMQIAVADPKAFCTELAAAFLPPPTKRRGVAATRS